MSQSSHTSHTSQTSHAATQTADSMQTVREEDAFDVSAVASWLPGHVHPEVDAAGLTGVPQVQQFTGGASNLTYLLRYPTRDLILRRPPHGTKAKGAHNMAREHDLQRALAGVFPDVPPMVARCADESVIGTEFYVMERIAGTILRADIPPELGMSKSDVRTLCENTVDTLLALHAVDVEASGLAQFGKGDGYVARQVSGWSERYRRAQTSGPQHGSPSFTQVMAWLAENQPADVAHCLIHNDYRFDNLVLAPDDPTRIVGVLDWELATVGDPLMDLGSALAYWVQADDDEFLRQTRRQPTHTAGMLTRDEVWQRYRAASGLEFSARQQLFYEVFGLFRLAVIAQQIYYRYAAGQTSNPAFAAFRPQIAYLHERCLRLISQCS